MGFRDDREAAHARAEALERELAERERELADTERALEAAETKLAAAEKARDEVSAAHERATADKKDARARLDKVASRTAKRERAARREARSAEEREREEAREERQLRILKSVSLWAEVEWSIVGIVMLVPLVYGTMLATMKFGRAFLYIVPIAIIGSVVLIHLLSPIWCRRQLRREYEWAETRDIAGYPEILDRKPRDYHHHVFRKPDGHSRLTVTLDFTGKPPSDLDAIMRGAEFEPSGPRRYGRESPVTHRRTKSGTIVGNEDHNRAIRKAVHALERDVLKPLRTAHGLTEVTITLR